jgi:signal transduction histidine kinase
MKEGLDDYVVKSPRHMIRLVTAVRSALEKTEARRQVAEAERERADLLRREQATRAEAEWLLKEAREADRRKDEFLAMLAHELRNPLAPIANAVHLNGSRGCPTPSLAGSRTCSNGRSST